jgi:hypothetical protein
MGWEQRGTNRYYYRKERDGSRVRQPMLAAVRSRTWFQTLNPVRLSSEKLMRAKKSIENRELARAEVALDRAVELIQLFTQAELLTAGFHTHKRQWRRKRDDR